MTTKQTEIHVALASNNGYVVLMAALIKSIAFNHHTDENIVFHLLSDQISKSNKEKINSSVELSPEIILNWIEAEEVFPPNIKFPADKSAFPKTAYLRLFAPALMKSAVKKLIYFDVDMIVRSDISQLWNIDLQGHTMAAVLDVGKTVGCVWGGIPNYKELGLPANAKYFNSGLMIIDCEQWVNQNIPKKVFKVMDDHIEHVNYADQYGLNVVFAQNWLEIDPLWNWFANNYHPNPYNIHFLDIKPFYKSYNSDLEFRKEFFKYLDMTPWKGMALKSDFYRVLHKAIIKIKKKLS
jgi:lipopolysaccharide biosynthesis glycosyltransferase